MTNLELVRQLEIKELAEMLVKTKCVNEGDFDYEENPIDWYVTYYISPDGLEYFDYEDAVERAIDWLNEEID